VQYGQQREVLLIRPRGSQVHWERRTNPCHSPHSMTPNAKTALHAAACRQESSAASSGASIILAIIEQLVADISRLVITAPLGQHLSSCAEHVQATADPSLSAPHPLSCFGAYSPSLALLTLRPLHTSGLT
jgi:hypothetical protein